MQKFFHLRLHTEYSINDSILRIADVIQLAKQNNLDALAITDFHNMFGMVKFYSACRKNSIKPILGAELSVIRDTKVSFSGDTSTQDLTKFHASSDNNPISHKNIHEYSYRIIVLIKNNLGLHELNQLITNSYLNNKLYDKPYIAESELLNNNQKYNGIIILSGGIYGDITQLILQNKLELATKKAAMWQKHFGDNYYLELHRIINYPNIESIVDNTILIANELGIAVVATNPIYFANSADYMAHEVRVCIANSERIDDSSRVSSFYPDQSFLPTEIMLQKFADIPSAIQNTVEIVKRCNLIIDLGNYSLPDFKVDEPWNLSTYFSHIVHEGLKFKFKEIAQSYVTEQALNPNKLDVLDTNVIFEDYVKRLKIEIDTIINMGFAGYFLIVADFINWAKKNNIKVGPGRGSGAGSLVAFCLGITDIDPICYGLLFERFLNPERVSMPDFDIDFCQEKRELVIEYVKQKYGVNAVAQIATFGTMSSKAVIKDVGRVLGLPYGLCDSLSKIILNTPAKSYSLLEAYDKFPELKDRIDHADDDVSRLWELSLRLEDLTRSVGKHAAGVLIAPRNLTYFCPLYLADNMQTSQLDKDDVEAVGLVKFDFLGLRNLTIIQEAIDNIKSLYDTTIELSTYDFNDAKVYNLLQSGNSVAIFQLESSGMRRVLVKLAPDRFTDIIALLALYRPGPLGSGMVDDFIRRKKGIDKPEYFHDDLRECLESTYGVIVYQEQVMQISQIIGGYTLGGADLLRRAMGKKKPEEMAKHKELFINGAKNRNYDIKLAENLFDLMAKFAEYGFNKSHSAAYAVISYHTAYLKAHYMSCFMAASLSSELDNTDKLYEFYADVIANNLIVLSPNINQSIYKFLPIDAKHIVYALGAIKGVGQNVVDLIVKERELNGHFKNFVDFCSRFDKRVLNKKTLESLIKAGAFDVLENNRAMLLHNITRVLDYVNDVNMQLNSDQASLFDVGFEEDNTDFENFSYVECDKWSLKETLKMEKQALGFYFSANLFDEYETIIRSMGIKALESYSLEAFLENNDDSKSKALVCGIVTMINIKPLKRINHKLVIIVLQDNTNITELILFINDSNMQDLELLKVDEFIACEVDITYDNFKDKLKFTIKNLYNIEQLLQKSIKKITLNLSDQDDEHQIVAIANSLTKIDETITHDLCMVDIVIYYHHELAKFEIKFKEHKKFILNYNNISLLTNLKFSDFIFDI